MLAFTLALALAPPTALPALTALAAFPRQEKLVQPPVSIAEVTPEWLDLYANIRLRAETTLDQPNGEDRTRGRLRFRVGAKMDIDEGLQGEVRLSSASGDANNAHWDFGGANGTDTLSGSDVALDRINLTWQPSEDWKIKGGKMGNPLASNPVFSEWVWDGDIQPAGLAATWDFDNAADLRLGHFVIDEENGPGNASDPAVTVMQLNLGLDSHEIDWRLNTSLWNWSNEGTPEANVWNTILSGQSGGWKASLEHFQNLDDNTGDDTGWVAGFKHKLGSDERAGTVFASYFDFDQNATLFGFGQDDLPIGPSAMGLSGYIAGYQHPWKDNTQLKLWILQGDDEVDDPLRIRFDIDVSF